MPTDADAGIDLRDILLEAQAEFAEIMREVLEELVQPQMVQALKAKWMLMPDELKEQLKAQSPEAYEAIMEVASNETKLPYRSTRGDGRHDPVQPEGEPNAPYT